MAELDNVSGEVPGDKDAVLALLGRGEAEA